MPRSMFLRSCSNYEIASRNYEIVSRYNEIASNNYKIVNTNYMTHAGFRTFTSCCVADYRQRYHVMFHMSAYRIFFLKLLFFYHLREH